MFKKFTLLRQSLLIFLEKLLRAWFSCSPFVPSEHGVKMIAPLEVCTKDKQHAVAHFLVSEGMKGAEIHRK
jgi:hypothetical protein